MSRVNRLFETLKGDAAVFISSYANIFYYSGFTSEDAYLVITAEKRYIITDSRYFVQARLQSPDFELIDIKKGWQNIFENIKETTVYFEENHLTYGMYKLISEKASDKELIPSQGEIDKPRRIKNKRELN